MSSPTRQLAAIMFTDIVGYTVLMGKDANKALNILDVNKSIQKPLVTKHNGKWLKEMGDGVLASFGSALDAVNCAVEIQEMAMAKLDAQLRIGIHLGDVTVEENDVHGDGVNVASRLQSIADPGGIYISDAIEKAIRGQSDIQTVDLGEKELKNVDYGVRTFAVQGPDLPLPGGHSIEARRVRATRFRTGMIFLGLLVVITMAIFILTKGFFETEDVTPQNKSIAVLPFKTIGGDPEGAYFADGVQEEILNHLSRIEGLKTKSRTAVEKFRERSPTKEELVDELQLTHYLEGSTRKEGNKIRITVQLINANTQDHVWADNYDREYANIWDTQSEIAQKIANTLKISISPDVVSVIRKKPTQNPDAWDDFLKAQYYLRRYENLRKMVELEQAVGLLKSAIRKDPDFALAYANLGKAYSSVSPDPTVIIDFVNIDSILILANLAINLDPSLSDPYVLRARYYKFTDDKLALQDFKQAIANDPGNPGPYLEIARFYHEVQWDLKSAFDFSFQSLKKEPEDRIKAEALGDIAWWYTEIADYGLAEKYINKALAFEPDNIGFLETLGHVHRLQNKQQAVLEIGKRINEISEVNRGLFVLALGYLLLREYQSSVDYFSQYFSEASETADFRHLENNHMYGYALLKTGKEAEGKRRLRLAMNYLNSIPGYATSEYEFAKIYSALGIKDSAYYYLEKAVEGPIHWGMSDFIYLDPLFDSIRDEPEFQRMAASTKEKVKAKKEEIRQLEEQGIIPKSLEEMGF